MDNFEYLTYMYILSMTYMLCLYTGSGKVCHIKAVYMAMMDDRGWGQIEVAPRLSDGGYMLPAYLAA